MVGVKQNNLLAIFLGLAGLMLALGILGVTEAVGFCWFKELTGYPCFSCGSTRALGALMHGDILRSLQINPVLLLTIVLATVFSASFLSDRLLKTRFLESLSRTQQWLTKPPVYTLLIALVVANWIWNIYKGL